jgi:hypothetical protein
MTDKKETSDIPRPVEPIVIRRVVCAACRYGLLILCSARHWDSIMHDQYFLAKATGNYPGEQAFEQGFIDQFGRFMDRKEAMQVAKAAGQQIDIKRGCGGDETTLYSEGLY